MVRVVMHFNPGLAHQVKHAQAFAASGVLGVGSPDGEADIHIVSGPNFALNRWRGHPNLLVIDRAFYGDPEYVQMFWLNPDGSRTYASGDAPRFKPELKPWKTKERGALILADFNQDVSHLIGPVTHKFGWSSVRRHPAESGLKSGQEPEISLAEELEISEVCIGHSSTALFEAVVMGVPVICTDPRNIVAEVSVPSLDAPLFRGNREAWLHRVSYMQWNHDEFGLALELLRAQREC